MNGVFQGRLPEDWRAALSLRRHSTTRQPYLSEASLRRVRVDALCEWRKRRDGPDRDDLFVPADDASISHSGILAGTPMYMAPEQALGQALDQRADLFSLGSVHYQMTTGRPPFRANGTVAVQKRVTEDTPRPIREIIPETATWLCDIIAKLHDNNPQERCQSAREVADVLADCERQLERNARRNDYSEFPAQCRDRVLHVDGRVQFFLLAGAPGW